MKAILKENISTNMINLKDITQEGASKKSTQPLVSLTSISNNQSLPVQINKNNGFSPN